MRMVRRRVGGRFLLALPLIIFIAIIGIFLLRLETPIGQPRSALIGAEMPNLLLPPLETLNMPPMRAEEIAARVENSVIVVNFWASWCVPCRAEHPFLMRLAERANVVIIGINYKDSAENAAGFISDLGNPFWRIGVDERGHTAIDWGVYGIPETFIINKEGKIAYKHIGPITQTHMPEILSHIEKALQGDL